MKKHYAKRDLQALDEYYTAHVFAMTAEALHSKSDIAAELAWRDVEIARLREALGPDASGAPLSELLHDAAQALRILGGGPLADRLHDKAYAVAEIEVT